MGRNSNGVRGGSASGGSIATRNKQQTAGNYAGAEKGKFETVNVTESYVRGLTNSKEFLKHVEDEAYPEEKFKQSNGKLEKNGQIMTYTYTENGETLYKVRFYLRP